MRRTWLIFSQAVTVVVAVLFVVGTLKPEWLRSGSLLPAQVSVVQAPAGAASGAGGFSAAARAALPAVVSIAAQKAPARNPHANDPAFRFFFGDRDEQAPSAGLGSGVIVSPEGYLLTNHHVIEGATDIDVRLADGREARARVVGTDPETDIAVLKIDLSPLPVVALGDVSRLSVGDAVLAIGNPFNVGQTVTSGIVSALGRNRLGLSTFENFIQTDAAINPGNSGGALVDARGALVGINTAIYSQSGGSLGIGFAVPVDLARQVMDDLVREGRVIRGWIGVEPRDLPADLAASLGLEKVTGVLITGVLQGGPAALAGVRPGDLVTAVGPRSVQTTADLLKAVAALKPKSVVALNLVRGGQRVNVEVTVGQRPVPGAAGNPR
jgi:Do/DeqQ family serine protease